MLFSFETKEFPHSQFEYRRTEFGNEKSSKTQKFLKHDVNRREVLTGWYPGTFCNICNRFAFKSNSVKHVKRISLWTFSFDAEKKVQIQHKKNSLHRKVQLVVKKSTILTYQLARDLGNFFHFSFHPLSRGKPCTAASSSAEQTWEKIFFYISSDKTQHFVQLVYSRCYFNLQFKDFHCCHSAAHTTFIYSWERTTTVLKLKKKEEKRKCLGRWWGVWAESNCGTEELDGMFKLKWIAFPCFAFFTFRSQLCITMYILRVKHCKYECAISNLW